MRYLPNAAQMKEADKYTIEVMGVPSMTLMERAARSVVDCIEEQNMDVSYSCIVCGSGNNGGDGFAVGRMLLEKGHKVRAYFAGNKDHCTKECIRQMELYEAAGGVIDNEYKNDEYSMIIDALFGVGLSRPVEGAYAELLQTLNRAQSTKIAVDIPSGISADNGAVLGTAFRADMTVTFQAEKLGLVLYPGREYAGNVFVTDIGIDTRIWTEDVHVAVTGRKDGYKALLPPRKEDSNKGTYGKLLVIAGSRGMSGAAYFNAKAAYRMGAGLVQIYTPEDNRVILQQMLPDAIITTYEFFDERELIRLLRWADTVCVGSGIGVSDKSKKIIRTVLEYAEVPVIVDADGLNILSGRKQYFENKQHKNYILTPHMKEMSRLTGAGVRFIKENRMEIAEEFADAYGVTCVLKDSRTVIQTGGEHPHLNLTGNSAMAKAGSGDVLAGMIAGLVCQGVTCHDAAVLGVYLHGKAGDKAKKQLGSYSVMAEDLIRQISSAIVEEEQ